jgi:hypothetical protein
MNPNLMHQMAQAHWADLMREAEGYRRARPQARPPGPTRLTARIPHFTVQIAPLRGVGRRR